MNDKKEKMKFLMSVDDHWWNELEKRAKKKRVTVQEYLRVIVIPDWLEKN